MGAIGVRRMRRIEGVEDVLVGDLFPGHRHVLAVVERALVRKRDVGDAGSGKERRPVRRDYLVVARLDVGVAGHQAALGVADDFDLGRAGRSQDAVDDREQLAGGGGMSQ